LHAGAADSVVFMPVQAAQEKVDFPHPDGPMKAVPYCREYSTFTSMSACFSPLEDLHHRVAVIFILVGSTLVSGLARHTFSVPVLSGYQRRSNRRRRIDGDDVI